MPATTPAILFGVAGEVPDVQDAAQSSIGGLRVAFSPAFGYAKPDKAVAAVVKKAVEKLESLGCIVEEVDKVFDKDPVTRSASRCGSSSRNTMSWFRLYSR